MAVRAFLAVYPPADVVAALDARLAPGRLVAPDLRWDDPAKWHVTLRFCGRVADVDALAAAVAPAVAARAPVSGVRFAGSGAFPKPRHGSVLWIGVAAGPGRDDLGALAATAEDACIVAGLAPDDRRFDPHVTVARTSRARDLRRVVAAVGAEPVGAPWTVTEVRLVASDTRATGAVHTEIARFPLAI